MKNFSAAALGMLVVVFSLWATVMLMTTVAHAAGGPWYVAPSGNDTNDCQGVATTCATINGALGKAGHHLRMRPIPARPERVARSSNHISG